MWEGVGLGRSLILIGLGILAVGIFVSLAERFPGTSSGFGWLGKLPGDIAVNRDNFRFYFPITTSLLLSSVLSLLAYLLSWLFRR
jgi:hypothetical protein